MIYLASPYNHEDPAVREERFLAACRVAAKLMRNEFNVFSPIAHSHPVAVHGGLDAVDHDFWMRRDLPMLRRCGAIMVLCMDGWEQSRGMAREIEEADKLLRERGVLKHYVAETEDWTWRKPGAVTLDRWIELFKGK